MWCMAHTFARWASQKAYSRNCARFPHAHRFPSSHCAKTVHKIFYFGPCLQAIGRLGLSPQTWSHRISPGVRSSSGSVPRAPSLKIISWLALRQMQWPGKIPSRRFCGFAEHRVRFLRESNLLRAAQSNRSRWFCYVPLTLCNASTAPQHLTDRWFSIPKLFELSNHLWKSKFSVTRHEVVPREYIHLTLFRWAEGLVGPSKGSLWCVGLPYCGTVASLVPCKG